MSTYRDQGEPRRRSRPALPRWIAAAICSAFVLSAPATASAFGFRLGGKFWVKPEADQQQFAFGLQHDLKIVEDVFFFNTGGTFSINDQYFLIESGVAGLRFAIPVADKKVLPGFRANVLLVWPIRFKPSSAGGFGFGGQFAPGVGFAVSEEVEIFVELDIDVFKYLTASDGLLDGSGDEDETQVHLNLMVGLRF